MYWIKDHFYFFKHALSILTSNYQKTVIIRFEVFNTVSMTSEQLGLAVLQNAFK